MTIRNRLALRFTGLVAAILLLVFVSIYAFCGYFIAQDFYRRLDRKAHTYGELIIRHRIDADLIRQLSRIRRDQLPNQKIMIFDGRDSVLFATNPAVLLPVPPDRLSTIRRQKQAEFRLARYSVAGLRFVVAGQQTAPGRATSDQTALSQPESALTPGRAGAFIVLASAENTYGDAFLRQLRWALGGLFALIAGLTAFSGWLYAGDALRPMQQIDAQLSRIFPRNRHERLPVGRDDDEMSRLSVTINRLLDRAAESFQLQRLFVANVSHELKNPLTQISSQLEVSLLNQRDPAAYRQTIRSVLDDVGELATLTHELLRLSQVNQDDAAGLLTDTVRVDELLWDVRDAVTILNPRYQVTIDLGQLPDDPDQLTVPGNKILLGTALKNLLENACKFSDDGRVRVGVRFGSATMELTIQNDGPPIPADDLPYIFEPFYRSRRTAEQVRGYGVGLALVERIVHLHGGRVSVTSEWGQPTTFRIVWERLDNLPL